MAIKNITQVSCSLNLGSIYSVEYQYTPENGVNIKLYFVNDTGIYRRPTLLPLQKALIQIGNAFFSMYPVKCEIELTSDQRVIWVEFRDEVFMLEKYYITLPGRGCGTNIFQLGTPVDNRTDTQKIATAIDPVAQQLKDLTQFPDYTYSFNEFIDLLRTKFNIQVLSYFDGSIRLDFVGSFANVLKDWCNYYNLSYFFENSIIKIFDPTTLTIILPTKPIDAISFSDYESIEETYGKTVCNWYQQNGDKLSLSQTSNSNGPLLVRTSTLYPVGYEFGLGQTILDLNQVAAAMYGQEFWFLYNYSLGSTSAQCGWTVLPTDSPLSINQTAGALNGQLVVIDDNTYEQKYQAYREYGENIAGRWYLSNEKTDLAIDQGYKWFDETQGPIFSFTNVDDRVIDLTFLTPTNDLINQIPNTTINSVYSGVNYFGNRMAYRDNSALSGVFDLGPLQGIVNQLYQAIYSIQNASSLNYSQLYSQYSGNTFTVTPIGVQIPPEVQTAFLDIPNQTDIFQPRNTSVDIIGISNTDYSTLKASQSSPSGIQIVNGSSGPNVISNTSVIKTEQAGSYNVYYNKYAQCASESTPDLYFGYQFDPHQISIDNEIDITFIKNANNTYTLNRNYNVINSLVNNPLLSTLAQARPFSTRSVTFSLNYFQDVPVNFLTNGLVSLSVSIGSNSLQATYTYSNEVLKVPDKSKRFLALEQQMKNTWTRTFQPNQVIT